MKAWFIDGGEWSKLFKFEAKHKIKSEVECMVSSQDRVLDAYHLKGGKFG